ncbi:hypothetical protein [Catenulispora pinisilvae]|nr:hypothetical protein [Catenulispora pinisilvae]
MVERIAPHANRLVDIVGDVEEFNVVYSRITPLQGVLRRVLLLWSFTPIRRALSGARLRPRFAAVLGEDWPWMGYMVDLVDAGGGMDVAAAEVAVDAIYAEVDDEGLYQLVYVLATIVAEVEEMAGGRDRLVAATEFLHPACQGRAASVAVLPQASLIVAAVSVGHGDQARDLMADLVQASGPDSAARILSDGIIPMMVSAMGALSRSDGVQGRVSDMLMVFDSDGIPSQAHRAADARHSADPLLRTAALARDLVAAALDGEAKARRSVWARMGRLTADEEPLLAWQLAVSVGLAMGQSIAAFEAEHG